MSEWIYAGLFFSFLVVAAIRDVADLRIPNSLTAAMAATGPGAVWLLGPGAEAVSAAILTGAITLGVGWTMFELGLLGGGDVKLASAAALWLGPEATLVFVLVTALCGSLLAATLLVMRRRGAVRALVRERWRGRLQGESIPVPYAAAMAPAGAVAMFTVISQLA